MLAALVAVLAATLFTIAPAGAGAPSSSGTGSAAVPRLDWAACAGEGLEAFECATAVVPLDYDRQKGKQITLALTRLPAADPGRRIGSLCINPGGPGGSGVEFVQGAGPFLYSDEVRARFDLVGFDPRGSIGSTPLRCYDTLDEAFAAPAPMAFPVTREEERVWVRSDRAQARACAERGGPILDHMSTANVARDMDLLRRAVGDAKLTYAATPTAPTRARPTPTCSPARSGPWSWTASSTRWPGPPAAATRPAPCRSRPGCAAPRAPTSRCWSSSACATPAAPTAPSPRATPSGATSGWPSGCSASRSSSPMIRAAPSCSPTPTWWARPWAPCTTRPHGPTSPWPCRRCPSWPTRRRPRPASGPCGPGAASSSRRTTPTSSKASPGSPAPRPTTRPMSAPGPGRPGPRTASSPTSAGPGPGSPASASPGRAGTTTATPAPETAPPPTRCWSSAPVRPGDPYHGAVTVDRPLPRSRLLTLAGWGHTSLFASGCTDAHVNRYLLTSRVPAKGTVCEPDVVPFAEAAATAQALQATGASSKSALIPPMLRRMLTD